MKNKALWYMVPLIWDHRAVITVMDKVSKPRLQGASLLSFNRRGMGGAAEWQRAAHSPPTAWTHRCLLHPAHASIPRVTAFHRCLSSISFIYAVPLPRILSPSCHCDQSLLMPSESVQEPLFPKTFPVPSRLAVLIFTFLIFYAYFLTLLTVH